MPDPIAELADRGRSLAPEERVRLMDLLLESLHQPAATDIEEAWNQEIARRVARYERGESVLYDVEDVLAEAARIAP